MEVAIEVIDCPDDSVFFKFQDGDYYFTWIWIGLLDVGLSVQAPVRPGVRNLKGLIS